MAETFMCFSLGNQFFKYQFCVFEQVCCPKYFRQILFTMVI